MTPIEVDGASALPETEDRECRPDVRLRSASGEVTSRDPLVVLLYILARSHLPVGTLTEVLQEVEGTVGLEARFTNGYLAEWAAHYVERVRPKMSMGALRKDLERAFRLGWNRRGENPRPGKGPNAPDEEVEEAVDAVIRNIYLRRESRRESLLQRRTT